MKKSYPDRVTVPAWVVIFLLWFVWSVFRIIVNYDLIEAGNGRADSKIITWTFNALGLAIGLASSDWRPTLLFGVFLIIFGVVSLYDPVIPLWRKKQTARVDDPLGIRKSLRD